MVVKARGAAGWWTKILPGSVSLPVFFGVPLSFQAHHPPGSLILSGFIAKEYKASLWFKRLWAFTSETVPREEGDESLLKTILFVWWE